jgi:hypothetical protein
MMYCTNYKPWFVLSKQFVDLKIDTKRTARAEGPLQRGSVPIEKIRAQKNISTRQPVCHIRKQRCTI